MGGRSKRRRRKIRKIVWIVYIWFHVNHFITVITTIRCASEYKSTNVRRPWVILIAGVHYNEIQ
jgi:hypothetical protein